MYRIQLVATAVALASSVAAHADDTGLAYSHDLRKEDGRLCIFDHSHSGAGSGRTRAVAQAAAVHSWADFTSFEYGSAWARWSQADNNSVRFTQKVDGRWSASVDARPCRG